MPRSVQRGALTVTLAVLLQWPAHAAASDFSPLLSAVATFGGLGLLVISPIAAWHRHYALILAVLSAIPITYCAMAAANSIGGPDTLRGLFYFASLGVYAFATGWRLHRDYPEYFSVRSSRARRRDKDAG